MTGFLDGAVIESSGIDTGDIPASLRFRGAQYLSRTPGSAGDRKTWTWSGWVKRGALGTTQRIISAATTDGFNGTTLVFDVNNKLQFYTYTNSGGIVDYSEETVSVFRDPTAHLHIAVTIDTTQATAANRVKIYVNGVQQTTAQFYGQVPQNYDTWINTTQAHYIGAYNDAGSIGGYFDGYLSRVCLVDGSALTPDSFGQLNTEINEWVSRSASSIKAVVDAGGTNSFMLDFDDATSLTTLGYDLSTKGNDWLLNGSFSLSPGTTYDHMLDVPGNSFATLNPLDLGGGQTASDANLKINYTSGAWTYGRCSSWMTTGKWYWEVQYTGAVNGGLMLGICNESALKTGAGNNDANFWVYNAYTGVLNSNTTNPASVAAASVNDIISFEFDVDTKTLALLKNDVLLYTFTGITGASFAAVTGQSTSIGGNTTWNFGQYPFHASATYHSAAGGYFRYTPPTGFLALCQANLEEPAILNPEDHHVDIPVLKSGDTPFTLPWDADTYDTFFEIKRRDAAGDWYQIDGLRGYDKILKSNSTAAETTDANVLGISGTTGTLKSTLADGTYIVSATKAGLSASRTTYGAIGSGADVEDAAYSITSTVSRNVASGFSIVIYNGNSTASSAVGHGLQVTPSMAVIYARSGGTPNRPVAHKSLTAGWLLYLDSTIAAVNGGTRLRLNSSTTLLIGDAADYTVSNATGYTYVAYCYADSAIQKSFSYTGNGSTDGPYVNLGFKCGRTLLKRTDAAGYAWNAFDSARNSSNVVTSYVQPNDSVAEGSFSTMDFISNCLKLRASDASFNASGGTYIGHAWASVTGKYSNSR